MVDQLKKRGLGLDPAIEGAFRTVPREAFLPGIPLERVYSGDAIVTKRDEEGRPTSSSSEVGIMIVTGLAVGIFDPDGGLALVEIERESIVGRLSLVIALGSEAARSRLLPAIDAARRIRLKDLQVIARPTGSPEPHGDVAVRRGSFTFAFRIASAAS